MIKDYLGALALAITSLIFVGEISLLSIVLFLLFFILGLQTIRGLRTANGEKNA